MQINWSLRELDVFLVLAATLSFRRNSAQVNLSQSAVSGVIARFEKTLAVRLFDRTTRSVQFIATGQVFAERALLLRAQTDKAVRAVRNLANLQVGQVTLAALPSRLQRLCLSPALATLRFTQVCSCKFSTPYRVQHLTWCALPRWISH